MIVREREPVVATVTIPYKEDRVMEFGNAMPDGRLTEPSNGKVYWLREAIMESKRLGRPLSEEEMKKFEVK